MPWGQLNCAMHVLRHYLKRQNFYPVPVRSLPDAGCDDVAVFEFSHHLVAVFGAPFHVPRVLPYAVASPEQILHEITFLF